MHCLSVCLVPACPEVKTESLRKARTDGRQWRRQEFSFGTIAQGGLGDEIPQKLKQFADIVYIF